MPTRLEFEVDPNVIHHFIYAQAGSIGKALIELLMNGIDASATSIRLAITNEGFTCADDGNGFRSEEDVMRYFRRFGTPHIQDDALLGRFRLGRGQIMAHAATIWTSNCYRMDVDPQTMGYAFDFDTLDNDEAIKGCTIRGDWYARLTDMELLSTLQEVRDLVRYTAVPIELNGRVISRNPASEKWDFEDDYAYYRARVDGAVAIYNLGVLVRNDPAKEWGAGGTIVSKQALSLNVSRTEILRKTCEVWKPIAAQYGRMADAVASRLGDHRKTEARREKVARDLLGGSPQLGDLALREEVITLLPGKRHVTFNDFLCGRGTFAVVEDGFDVPKGEAIARQRLAVLVHPQTLTRFGCESTDDFIETVGRVISNLREFVDESGREFYMAQHYAVPEFVSFSVLRDAFVDRTEVVSEKDVLDRETRRVWTALRGVLEKYTYRCGDSRRRHRSRLVIGRSSADAWTDGETYIAINEEVVKALRGEPVITAARIFAMVDHELAHEGDSLDCGHDEAFWQRHHDRTIEYSGERQRYIHVFLARYTRSMQMEGRHRAGRAQRERHLIEMAGTGRAARGLPPALTGVEDDPLASSYGLPESMTLVDAANVALVERGKCPPPADWLAVLTRARIAREADLECHREAVARRKAHEDVEAAEWHLIAIDDLAHSLGLSWDQAEQLLGCDAARDAIDHAMREVRRAENDAYQVTEVARIARVLSVSPDVLTSAMLKHLWEESPNQILQLWAETPWEQPEPYPDLSAEEIQAEMDAERAHAEADDPRERLDAELWNLVLPGETWWSIRRNAAVAGFSRVPEYLRWRHEVADADCAVTAPGEGAQ